MRNQIIIKTTEGLEAAAQWLIQNYGQEKIFAFYGEMGSGKTTFISAICKNLGVAHQVSSPTFSIVNEYHGSSKIYHMDLYRLNNFEEVWAIGIEEYLLSGNYCFIEWPQLIIHLLPSNTVNVQISVLENNERLITIK